MFSKKGAYLRNQLEEEEDGSAIADAIYVVIVIHEGFDCIDETWVKLLSLVEDEQSLRAAQHHVPDSFSQLALETARKSKPSLKITKTSRSIRENKFNFTLPQV